MDFYAFLLLAHKRLAVLENSCLFFHKDFILNYIVFSTQQEKLLLESRIFL